MQYTWWGTPSRRTCLLCDGRRRPYFTLLAELTYTPVSYMEEMVSKHMAIKDKLPPFTLAVWCNGPACGNPAAFTNVAMAAGQYGAKYVEGVRANLMAGGDNCSRSCLIGALLAAEVRVRDPCAGRGMAIVQ